VGLGARETTELDIVPTTCYEARMWEKGPSRKEQQARKTRRRILSVAAKLFARHGYHKTTVNDIARGVGMTTGAVFHYFPSKEALLDALVEWLARGLRVYSDYLNGVTAPSAADIGAVVRIMCDHFRRQPEATICLAALATEFAGSGHPIEERIKSVYGIFVDAFARVLRSHPGVQDPRATAIASVGAMQGIAVPGLLRESEQPIEGLARGFLALSGEWPPEDLGAPRGAGDLEALTEPALQPGR